MDRFGSVSNGIIDKYFLRKLNGYSSKLEGIKLIKLLKNKPRIK